MTLSPGLMTWLNLAKPENDIETPIFQWVNSQICVIDLNQLLKLRDDT